MGFPALLFALAIAVCAWPVSARVLAQVSVYDRRDGQELPIHFHDGRRYVVGEPGREYEIRVRNLGAARLLAVTSVDGINVLSGDRAAPDQAGYVLDAHGQTRIEGWRNSLSEVAAFAFTRMSESYAARTGRPHDVGVIGVALFREQQPCCRRWRDDTHRPGRNDAPAPMAESNSAPRGGADAGIDLNAPRTESQVGRGFRHGPKASERIGTGHGPRLDSSAYEVAFERASDAPDEVITIWYDARAHLIAQGVIPPPHHRAQRRPVPFPAARGFVPDP